MKRTQSYKKEIRINGRRMTKRFTRLSDAERWYDQMKREKELVESGLAPSVQETLLSDYAANWLERRKQQGKPLGSWLTDEERLRKWILPVFGLTPLQRISPQELELFLDKLVTKEGLSPTTRNRVRALLHKLYNDAKRQGLIQINPVSNVIVWKENREAFDYFHTVEECRRYLLASRDESPSFFMFAIFALNTGARLGELLALQNQDLDLANRRLHIWKLKELRNGEICKRTKGGSDRWLGLNDELVEAIRSNREFSRFQGLKDFLIHEADGSSMYARKVRELHWRTCKRAGLKKIRVHDLRHTFASHFVMNGGSLHDLQALLGHSSPMMTQRYAHLAPGYLETKAQVVRFAATEPLVKILKVVK